MTNTITSLFAARREQFESANSEFFRWVESPYRYYSTDSPGWDLYLLGEVEQRESALIETPATTLEEVGYKAYLSWGQLDELAEDPKAIGHLKTAMDALQVGDARTAKQCLETALEGETVNAWAYAGANAALDDLQRMEGYQ